MTKIERSQEYISKTSNFGFSNLYSSQQEKYVQEFLKKFKRLKILSSHSLNPTSSIEQFLKNNLFRLSLIAKRCAGDEAAPNLNPTNVSVLERVKVILRNSWFQTLLSKYCLILSFSVLYLLENTKIYHWQYLKLTRLEKKQCHCHCPKENNITKKQFTPVLAKCCLILVWCMLFSILKTCYHQRRSN